MKLFGKYATTKIVDFKESKWNDNFCIPIPVNQKNNKYVRINSNGTEFSLTFYSSFNDEILFKKKIYIKMKCYKNTLDIIKLTSLNKKKLIMSSFSKKSMNSIKLLVGHYVSEDVTNDVVGNNNQLNVWGSTSNLSVNSTSSNTSHASSFTNNTNSNNNSNNNNNNNNKNYNNSNDNNNNNNNSIIIVEDGINDNLSDLNDCTSKITNYLPRKRSSSMISTMISLPEETVRHNSVEIYCPLNSPHQSTNSKDRLPIEHDRFMDVINAKPINNNSNNGNNNNNKYIDDNDDESTLSENRIQIFNQIGYQKWANCKIKELEDLNERQWTHIIDLLKKILNNKPELLEKKCHHDIIN